MPEWSERRHYLDYDSGCAMRYHGRRQAFLDFTARISPVLSIVTSGSAFVAVVDKNTGPAAFLMLLTAALGVVNLSFGVSERARKHEDWFKRWSTLRGDLSELDEDDEAGLRRLEVKRAALDAECPGQLTALSVICENEEKQQRGQGPIYHVGPLTRVFAHLWTAPWWHPKKVEPSKADVATT